MTDRGNSEPKRPAPAFNRAADSKAPPSEAKTVSNTHHVPKPPQNAPRGPGETPRGAVRVAAPAQSGTTPKKAEPTRIASLKQEFRAAAEKKSQDKDRPKDKNR